jgi:hypothetical protein
MKSEAGPGKSMGFSLKTNWKQKDWGMAQVVEGLRPWVQSPSTTKTKTERERERERSERLLFHSIPTISPLQNGTYYHGRGFPSWTQMWLSFCSPELYLWEGLIDCQEFSVSSLGLPNLNLNLNLNLNSSPYAIEDPEMLSQYIPIHTSNFHCLGAENWNALGGTCMRKARKRKWAGISSKAW